MYEYDEECLKTFILNQGQLFDEPVAETLEEAEAFLEDCMASIVDSIDSRSITSSIRANTAWRSWRIRWPLDGRTRTWWSMTAVSTS